MTPAQRAAVIAHLSAGWKNVTKGVNDYGRSCRLLLVGHAYLTEGDINYPDEGYGQVPDDLLEAAFKLSLLEHPARGLITEVDGIGKVDWDGWIEIPI